MFPWLGRMSQWQAYQLGPPLYNISLTDIIEHARQFSALPYLSTDFLIEGRRSTIRGERLQSTGWLERQ